MTSVNKIKDKLICDIENLELKILGFKALLFDNYQTFDSVYKSFKVGEVIELEDRGYAIVLFKDKNRITFKTVVKNGKEWIPQWQDSDKILKIKKGIYYDILTNKEHNPESVIYVPAHYPTYFKSIGKDDLVIYGEIYKNNEKDNKRLISN